MSVGCATVVVVVVVGAGSVVVEGAVVVSAVVVTGGTEAVLELVLELEDVTAGVGSVSSVHAVAAPAKRTSAASGRSRFMGTKIFAALLRTDK